jgi:rhodanese-related sulfurtransferase
MIRIIITTVLLALTVAVTAQVTSVSPETAARKIKNRNVTVLDVRTVAEFKEGHLQRSVNIDVLDSASFVRQIALLPRNKTYVVYCRSGKRSLKAAEIMQQQGFSKVLNMKGGILEWKGGIIQSNNQK